MVCIIYVHLKPRVEGLALNEMSKKKKESLRDEIES